MINYLRQNGVFYHFFPQRRLERILNEGLPKNEIGVAVFRDFLGAPYPLSIINDVIEYGIQDMLNDKGDNIFYAAMLKYTPEDIESGRIEIIPDYSNRLTNPLHNYIITDERIRICEKDIVLMHLVPGGIKWSSYVEGIKDSGILSLHQPLNYPWHTPEISPEDFLRAMGFEDD